MNTQQLQLVTFEQAKRLKELGFNWENTNFYNSVKVLFKERNISDHNFFKQRFSAPTIALALKWFRDEKCIISEITSSLSSCGWSYTFYINPIMPDELIAEFNTYESAESALLNELLTLLEKK